jgi:hypothetical protein
MRVLTGGGRAVAGPGRSRAVARAVASSVARWSAVAERGGVGGGAVDWPGDRNDGGGELLARGLDCSELLSVCSGEEEEGGAAFIPPFSPSWWLQPGLKGGL